MFGIDLPPPPQNICQKSNKEWDKVDNERDG